MNVTDALLIALLVVATALCGVGIWALVELVKTARSVRVLSDDLDLRVIPLLDKADVTVDAMNAELLRIDSIVTQVEEVTERFESTSRTISEVANAPAEIANDLADRVRRAWKTRKRAAASEGETADDASEHDEDETAADVTDDAPHVATGSEPPAGSQEGWEPSDS